MAVVHAADELLEEVARLVLDKTPSLDDAVKQLAARRILHDDGKVRGRQEYLQAHGRMRAVSTHGRRAAPSSAPSGLHPSSP